MTINAAEITLRRGLSSNRNVVDEGKGGVCASFTTYGINNTKAGRKRSKEAKAAAAARAPAVDRCAVTLALRSRGPTLTTWTSGMESSELDAEISVPVVLVSRDSLYVIVAVLSASVLGCVAVVAYSFTNYNNLRQNAEEVRNYIASLAKAAELKKSGYGGAGQPVAGGLSATMNAPVPAASADGSQNVGMPRGGGVLFNEAAKDKLTEVARQEVSSAENLVPDAQHQDKDLRAGTVGIAAAVPAAANASSSATLNGTAEAA
ncbi:hypothetical protein V5799_031328 [Amblyomma americanum]|uniref:Uncharacterized protein n=1 Tax=Amblyomma americanum TaxID=6943 RepID=A0AAQ4EKK5_AMBAM